MKQIGVLFVVSLLVLPAIGSAFAGGTIDAQTGNTPDSTLASSPPLEVKIDAVVSMIDAERPALFVVRLFNPSENSTQSGLLTVGVSPPDDNVLMEVDDEEPYYEHENKRTWATYKILGPGELDLMSVVVYPGSRPGHYELNATISYINGGEYTKDSDTGRLLIDSDLNRCTPVFGWVQCNWRWVIPLLSLLIATLSFFGYERIRSAVAGDELEASETESGGK